jgi:CheY-like chemotaxis protein
MSRVPTAGEHLPGGLILVVEDDPLILEFLCEILQDEGFVVQPQISADAASQYLEQHAQDVRMLLTDITMPGKLNGADLANLFGDRWPDKPIMIMSGFRDPRKLGRAACGFIHQETLGPRAVARLRTKRIAG